MSKQEQSDPRLLLPEWLRDEGPLPAPSRQGMTPGNVPVPVSAPATVSQPAQPIFASTPLVPYSERLSLDTRLDPATLVAATDLPGWLGGVVEAASAPTSSAGPVDRLPVPTHAATPLEAEPYEEIDEAADEVVEFEIGAGYLVGAAIALLVLLGAALRLYLS